MSLWDVFSSKRGHTCDCDNAMEGRIMKLEACVGGCKINFFYYKLRVLNR